MTHVAIQITIRILCTYVCKYEFFEKKPKYHIYVTYRYVHYICMKRLYFTSTTFCFFLFLVSISRDLQTHRQKDTQTETHTCHYCFYIGYWIRTVRVDNNMLRSFSHGTRVTGTYAEMCINFVDFLKWINLVIKKNRIRYYGSTGIINHEVFSYQKLFPPYVPYGYG